MQSSHSHKKPATSPETFTIGDVARQVGLRPSAMRYYESVGVLPASKRVSGQRLYDADVFRQIRCIRSAQRAGFSIEEMKTLFDNSRDGKPYALRLQDLAQRKLVDVEKLIADAQAMKRILETGLNCSCAAPENCLVLMNEESSI